MLQDKEFQSWKVGATDRDGDPVAFNALRFATYHEAGAYAANLEGRWLACRRTEIVPSTDPVTHEVDKHGRAVALGSWEANVDAVAASRTAVDVANSRLILGSVLAAYHEEKMR